MAAHPVAPVVVRFELADARFEVAPLADYRVVVQVDANDDVVLEVVDDGLHRFLDLERQ